MPRQFINRGDRLVFSNGIVVLAVVAGLLIVLFDAEVTRLIQLYVVGVFTSFTLSQAGMVVRWRRLREPGWRRLVALNGIGAVTTGVVLAVVAATKFTKGAWIVVVAAPLIILMFKAIHRHYESVGRQLRLPSKRPREITRTRALLLVARLDAVTLRALGYARSLRPMELRALHVGRGDEAAALAGAWRSLGLPVPLEIVDGDAQGPVDPIRAYIRGLTLGEDEMLTAVVPEVVFRSKVGHYLRRRRTLLLKAALLFERRVTLTDVTLPEGEGTETATVVAPTRVIAIVLVSAVHNATLRALEYARSLSPTELRAVSFNVDAGETDRILREWGSTVDDVRPRGRRLSLPRGRAPARSLRARPPHHDPGRDGRRHHPRVRRAPVLAPVPPQPDRAGDQGVAAVRAGRRGDERSVPPPVAGTGGLLRASAGVVFAPCTSSSVDAGAWADSSRCRSCARATRSR